MTSRPDNIDLHYAAAFRQSPAAKKIPALINAQGDNQYMWVYARNGFLTGVYWGSFAGVASSVYYRRLLHIPMYAVATGTAYATFHWLSAYFRNEI